MTKISNYKSYSLKIISIMLAFLAVIQNAYATPPNAPTGVAATDGSFLTTIGVTWSAPVGGGVDTYEIYRSVINDPCGVSGSLAGSVSSAFLAFNDTTGLVNGQVYYYGVKAVNSSNEKSGCSVPSDSGYLQSTNPPLPPTNVQATQNLLDKITVTWSNPPALSEVYNSFEIYRSTSSTAVCEGISIASPSVPSLTYNDTTATAGIVYYYTMLSVGPNGRSACTPTRSLGFRLLPPPPLTPANVQASDGTFTDKILVTWQAPVGSETISTYRLYRSTTPGSLTACQTLLQDNIPSSVFSLNDTSGVIPGKLYYYSMKSTGPTGESQCSLIDPGYAKIAPPANVQASDGTYLDKVQVTWSPPLGEVTGYKLYKSDTPQSCLNLIQTFGSPSTLSYPDFLVTQEVNYYYSLKTVSTAGDSDCSPFDPGFARKIPPPANVQASDGTFPDKVQVTWIPPNPSAEVTGFKIYRSPTPLSCQDLIQTLSGISVLSFDDTNVTPAVNYYYSLKTISAAGDSDCSPVDPGFAKVSPPNNVQATDGTFPDKVQVTWLPPAPILGVTGYKIYRSPTPLSCQTLIQTVSGPSTVSFDDTSVTQGTIYYYSLKSTSALGDSNCSPIDPGFSKKPVTICSNGLDDDLDGLIDLDDPGCKGDPNRNDEKDPNGPQCDNGLDDDGDGKIDFRIDSLGDPSCSSPRDGTEDDTDVALQSPAYIKFNTYLGQWNFAELVNQGVGPKQVDLTLYNLLGKKMISRSYVVPPQSQVDVDVNALLQFACTVTKTNCEGFEDLSSTKGVPNGLNRPDGVVDTYGLVELVFTDDNTAERLLGRMSFYRPNKDSDSYSFAFAREFKNANKGTAYGTANTYDPQGNGFLVPNWAEVINLDTVARSFTVNVFNQDGQLKASRGITLQPLGEFDVQAGHEFVDSNGKVVEGVFLVEVIPQDALAPYYLSVSRYSSNSLPGVDPETYNYALSIDGLSGTTDRIFAPIANALPSISGLTEKPILTNWLEVVNVDSVTANVDLSFKSANGVVLFSQSHSIPPKGQFHFNAGALLPKGTSGSVEIKSNANVISQGMSYAHGTDNTLLSGFSSIARPAGAQEQVGTINTFLGMKNVFELVSTSGTPSDLGFKITTVGGSTNTGVLGLGSNTNQAFQITDNSSLNISANTYGAMIFKADSAGKFMGEVRRIRASNGRLDFVMPTGVR